MHEAEKKKSRRSEGWCEVWLGLRDEHLGHRREALAHFEAGLSIWTENEYEYGKIMALANMGRILSLLGEQKKALDYLQSVIPIQEKKGLLHEQANTLNNIGEIYRKLDELDQALPITKLA